MHTAFLYSNILNGNIDLSSSGELDSNCHIVIPIVTTFDISDDLEAILEIANEVRSLFTPYVNEELDSEGIYHCLLGMWEENNISVKPRVPISEPLNKLLQDKKLSIRSLNSIKSDKRLINIEIFRLLKYMRILKVTSLGTYVNDIARVTAILYNYYLNQDKYSLKIYLDAYNDQSESQYYIGDNKAIIIDKITHKGKALSEGGLRLK